MRRLVLSLAFLAPAVLAQPALTSEASVDKAVYATGETITLRYTVRNEGDERTALWGECDSPGIVFDSLTSPGDGVYCTTMPDSTGLPARSSVTWVWTLQPDSLGVPERGGTQTIVVRTNGRCGLDFDEADPCPLEQTVMFEAPEARSGPLRVEYLSGAADSVLALKEVYGATVEDSTVWREFTYEQWVVPAVPLSETVAALNANDVFTHVYIDREVFPAESFATPARPRPAPALITAPVPNPTGGAATFTVRLDRAESVTVDLVDLLGRRVAVLHDGPLTGGVAHRFVLATGGLPAGVYVVRVEGAGLRETRRVTVAR